MTDKKDKERSKAYEDWKRDRDLEERRKANREKYPEFAKFFDEIQKVFPGAYVTKITPRTPTTHGSTEADEKDDQQ